MTSSNGNIFRVTGHLCGEFTGPGKFPAQRPVTRSFDAFFDLCLNKRLSKQPRGWWFETPSWSLWRQCNEPSEVNCRCASLQLLTRCNTISQDRPFLMLMLCFARNVFHVQCGELFLQVLWIQQLRLDKIQRTGMCFVSKMSYTLYASRLSMLCDKVCQSLSCHQQPVLREVLSSACLWPSYALSRLSSEWKICVSFPDGQLCCRTNKKHPFITGITFRWWGKAAPQFNFYGTCGFGSMFSLLLCPQYCAGHDDVIKWKHFPRYWPFVRGIHRSPVNSRHKSQWRGALMFSLICVWINDWVKHSWG